MKLFKKKNWAYYLCLFAIFTVAFFLVSLLFGKHDVRYAVISGLVSGVIFTLLWLFLDKVHPLEKLSNKIAKNTTANEKEK